MIRKIVGISLVLAAFSSLVVFAGASLVHAQVFQSTVQHGKTVDSSVYASSKTVTIDGVVNGDVFCAGQSVNIVGTVHGDVMCAGQSVSVTGTVDGSVRLAGQTVTLSGHVGRNATITAADAELIKGSHVAGDVTVLSATSGINGTIGRDLFVNGSVSTVSGTVSRNLRSNAGQLTLASGAHIKGSLTYISNTAADLSAGRVDGATTHTLPQRTARHNIFTGFAPAWFLYVLAAGLVFSLILVLTFPQTVNRLAGYPTHKLGRTILTGFLGSFAVPILTLVLFVSIIGVPLAVLVLILEIALALLSGPVAAYYIGSMVLAKSRNAIAVMMAGSLILILLCFIPVAGALAVLLAYYIGLGAILLSLKEAYTKPHYAIK